MVLIKKIVATYQYIYFRLLIYHIKEWQGIKKIGSFNSNFAITASAIALIYSIELIYRRICGTSGFLNDEQSIIFMALSVVIIHSLIFSQDDKKLIAKYTPHKEEDPYWKLKGYLSLTFVFGPVVLLLFLM